MKFFLISLVFIFISNQVIASSFDNINLKGFEKERITSNKMRYSSSKDFHPIVYLQVDHIDQRNKWSSDSFNKDMKLMLEKREKIYNVLGFSKVKFDNVKHSNLEDNLSEVDISGSYEKLNHKKVFFSEKNIYFEKKFLQIKVISEEGELKSSFVDDIVAQINLKELE